MEPDRAESLVQQAPRAPVPDRFAPQLATLAARAPDGDRWLHEIKYDGYRIGCRIADGRVRLFSRRGNDWTREFEGVARAAAGLNVRSAFLDGEVAALAPDGRTDFQALQNALSGARVPLVYLVFDVLHLDGHDLTALPLDARRQILEAVIPALDEGVLRRSRAWVGHGPGLFAKACELGLEGIVSKRRDAAYRAGRSECWLKVKCTASDVFVIGGFTEPEGTGRSEFGALLLGREEADHLVYVGKVGTGFSAQTMRSLRALLDPDRTEHCPFAPRPTGWVGKHGSWVRPVHRAKIRFTEWTQGQQLRHPSFLGLCEEPAQKAENRGRKAAPTGRGSPGQGSPGRGSAAQGSAAQGSPDPGEPTRGRVLPREDDVLSRKTGLTRREVIAYYEAIAAWMLPHVERRPLTLVRCKKDFDGCSFMHHAGNLWAPDTLPRIFIHERTKVGEYLVVEAPEHLVSLARAGVIELHTWNTRTDHVELPDRLVFDLDPGPEVPWRELVASARWVREALASLGLESFVKTTGGAGLHVVVPITPREDWAHCFAFTRAFATLAARERPSFSTSVAKKGREAKIFIDYLRNNRTNTSVAAYSIRATPHAPVSVPLDWSELTSRLSPATFTMAATLERMRRLRSDAWPRSHGQALPRFS